MSRGPILIDLEEETDAADVATAPPVPESTPEVEGRAMQIAARVAARPPSRLARWFWGLVAPTQPTDLPTAPRGLRPINLPTYRPTDPGGNARKAQTSAGNGSKEVVKGLPRPHPTLVMC